MAQSYTNMLLISKHLRLQSSISRKFNPKSTSRGMPKSSIRDTVETLFFIVTPNCTNMVFLSCISSNESEAFIVFFFYLIHKLFFNAFLHYTLSDCKRN